MESSESANFHIPVLLVLYDFRYLWKDNREVFVRKGEKLLLLEKTNNDWWQVVRPAEKKSFFVPAQYVEVLENERADSAGSSSGIDYDDSVLYENLESLKQQGNFDLPNISSFQEANEERNIFKEKSVKKFSQDTTVKQKPVPKTRTKVINYKSIGDCADTSKCSVSDVKNSYLQNTELYKFDKSDKSKLNDKKSQDLIYLKESNSLSILPSQIKNCRGKNAPVAVENVVYCNVPFGESKNLLTKHRVQPSDIQNKINIDAGKNRMKNTYNLSPKPFKKPGPQKPAAGNLTSVKHEATTPGKEKLKLNHNFSKSLEKLAEEIQFEPKKIDVGAKLLSVDNYNKARSVKIPKDNLEKEEKKGKTSDASLVLDETKSQPQSRSVFSRFRRSLHHSSSFKSNNLKKLAKSSKKACELSLSWEGGLDKIQEKKENEEKIEETPPVLQRSRTFIFAERSPLIIRPANKIFTVRHRLDTAYHSQRKPEEKVTLSTFKPIFNIDGAIKPFDPVKKQFHKELSEPFVAEKEKLLSSVLEPIVNKTSDEMEWEKKANSKFKSDFEGNKTTKIMPGNLPPYENVSKVYPNVSVSEFDITGRTPGQKDLALYNEPYSNSESDDNLEEKSLVLIANKSLKSQSSMESNLTVSEETEASESDENDSLEFQAELSSQSSDRPVNKRRTSLVRSSRVESTKARKMTARLPPTPSPEQRPLKDLGGGWGAYFSNGRSYYYNENTGEKNWKPPRKTVGTQEKRFVGSHESLSSDVIRSDTSSPLNENCQFLSSLNHSTGSLKSANLDSGSFETSNFGLTRSWKEGSPDLNELNRSYNSSPIAGLSQSPAYSFSKSSRDSLNRFSPIENVPSEEEGLELQDHVYQEDVFLSTRPSQLLLGEERKSKSSERIDTSTFHVSPGWEKFYDENSDQIYYKYKDKKEKWILSFDSEERAYFFEETSKKALWALPNYRENTKVEYNYPIQRSATESAINNETSAKLRLSKDGGQVRISASTRSSKAQSMLIEPKLEISPKDGSKTFSMPRDLSKIYGEIIRIGVLNKTKILENGKKLRKNWTPSFIVLTDSYLFFFKDAKSFQNMKHVIGSSSSHMCLSLQGAVIEKGDKISSRKNVYKISCSDNTEVLIQSEKPSDAEEWFKEINSVIQKLPQDCTVKGSPLSDSKSPSKVGRTKSLKDYFYRYYSPVKRDGRSQTNPDLLQPKAKYFPLTHSFSKKCEMRTKDTGSMEDLSSTPEERQNKIKARLKKFFIRRPTVDSLKKKGIWKDEPVFGCSLEQITKNRNPRVPVFVEKCIECIESKEENMKTDGLYRASGNLSQVQKIRLEVDQNNLNIMKEEEDVHVLTGSLKLFFRELKEPLIPSKQLEPALLATDKHTRKEKIKDFQKIVKSLPTPNYDTLKFLLQHLLRVKEYHKFNRMNINNLAIVFGPTLMWPEQESANMALELMQQNVVIECLLKEFQEIFT